MSEGLWAHVDKCGWNMCDQRVGGVNDCAEHLTCSRTWLERGVGWHDYIPQRHGVDSTRYVGFVATHSIEHTLEGSARCT